MSKISDAQLHNVDWSTLPTPEDDGGADHLADMKMPSIPLSTTGAGKVDFSKLDGRAVIFAYPMTGPPSGILPDGWDMIPGARGCTPQACAVRDMAAELSAAGVDHLFGLSTQETDYQQEAVDRLHLPYSIASDTKLALTTAMNLPVMIVEKRKLLKRLTLVLNDGRIERVFYPVFPPDESPGQVLDWLNGTKARS